MTCQFCDQDYIEPSAIADCCPGCAEHGACEDCGERSAGAEVNQWLCEPCAAKWLDNYEPPEPDLSGPTLRERHAHEAEMFHRERFK